MPSHEGELSQRQGHGQSSADQEDADLSSTPPRPSYSPVTPTIPPTGLASTSTQPPLWSEEPPAKHVSLEENPDAIAVRAAISILQQQRQKSLQDIRDLDKMKAAALRDPEAFLIDLKAAKLSNKTRKEPAGRKKEEARLETVQTSSKPSSFGTIPEAQNIVRAPAINWAKYHIVGESLDKLHEQQRRRPDSGEPGAEDEMDVRPEYAIAAPYRPFVDKVQPGTERRASRG